MKDVTSLKMPKLLLTSEPKSRAHKIGHFGTEPLHRLTNLFDEQVLPDDITHNALGRAVFVPISRRPYEINGERLWRPIEQYMTGFPVLFNKYYVSNYGEVIMINHMPKRDVKKENPNVPQCYYVTPTFHHGYNRALVQIANFDKQSSYWYKDIFDRVYVDYIVSQAFNYRKDTRFLDIVHIDMNPMNCAIWNLIWVPKKDKHIYEEAFSIAIQFNDPYWSKYFLYDDDCFYMICHCVFIMRDNEDMTIDQYLIQYGNRVPFPMYLHNLITGNIRPYLREKFIKKYGSIPNKCMRTPNI